ncbi:hypothetical protein SKAU_G00033420 [Synaphobranchus kaupii]|uniref:Uncharacterized protein n=1 Tax=Synaphobranchus kaupii TaxID=118154 RepID=A0A9Q1GEA9_SYNKA|nr:hypothetical protein SKAU_G00033420 [Synaphobranchus kaupii]
MCVYLCPCDECKSAEPIRTRTAVRLGPCVDETSYLLIPEPVKGAARPFDPPPGGRGLKSQVTPGLSPWYEGDSRKGLFD